MLFGVNLYEIEREKAFDAHESSLTNDHNHHSKDSNCIKMNDDHRNSLNDNKREEEEKRNQEEIYVPSSSKTNEKCDSDKDGFSMKNSSSLERQFHYQFHPEAFEKSYHYQVPPSSVACHISHPFFIVTRTSAETDRFNG